MNNYPKRFTLTDDYSTPSICVVEISVEQGFAITAPANTPGYNKETDDYD